MLLRSLSLHNIRSYRDASISFPQGRILLSGDVGSGKTSILLSIEFALFGILRGELAASSLLRHGESEARVELSFSVRGQEHVVVRTLRRDGKGVKQGNGSLDGESLTPVELKARVLSILGYSSDLLTKAKSLVFRYTVYTPQEEMKRILFEDADARLETLRKVFGIDQYRSVQRNVALTLRELRSEERARLVQLEEFPHKEQERKRLEESLRSVEEERSGLAARIREQEGRVKAQQERVSSLKEEADRYQELRRRHAALKARREQVAARQERLKAQVRSARESLPAASAAKAPDLSLLQERIKRLEGQLEIIDGRLAKAHARQASLRASMAQAQKAKEGLEGLQSVCPLCRQEVPHEHKDALLAEQEGLLAKDSSSSSQVASFIAQAEQKRSEISSSLAAARREVLAATREEERLKGLRERLKGAEEELSAAEEELAGSGEEYASLSRRLEQGKSSTKAFEEESKALEGLREALHALKVHEASLSATLSSHKERVGELRASLERLRHHKERVSSLQSVTHWLKESFSPLTDRVEKAVFSSLHQEFTALFSSWFDQVIDDEVLRVWLDEEFSPVVELNGYETEIGALSGGEKTAVALAYRLALNQVINDFMGTVATRGLLILDEPTDGFSSYQLERLRDVLLELNSEQVLIVSHELQVEGFVEHVIRVRKEAHVSVIEQ